MQAPAGLPWLPRPSDDFRAICGGLTAGQQRLGDTLRELAHYAHDGRTTEIFSRTIRRLALAGADLSGLQPVRIAVLSNATMDMAVAGIIAAGARHGFHVDVTLGGLSRYYQDAVDASSDVQRADPDIILIALDHRAFGFADEHVATPESVTTALALLDRIRRGSRRSGRTTVIVQTLAPQPLRLTGSADAILPGTAASAIAEFNRRLVEDIAGNGNDVLLDIAHLASTVGLSAWHDPTHWHSSKLPFSPDFLALYGEHVARTIAAVYGRSRKCLVLDLDDTLWGGAIGDDGLEGIVLGQGSGTGEAFVDFQKTGLALHNRGIVLAVCSKNDREQALLPFRHHPDMVLREDHIGAFQANWDDKARNLKAIARDLNIGLDTLVFVDDNPAERALIRQVLPMVAVPELPEDPACYSTALLSAGYFETIRSTESDRIRNRFYADNARRAELLADATDVELYLRSLNMVITFESFAPLNRSRVAQLINKTNQFNLTARRCRETEIAALEADAGVFTLAVRVRDKFGDNGLISALVCDKRGPIWNINTWVMSCRVFQRRIEHAMLNRLAAAARSQHAAALVGEYRPSPRNDVVQDLYRSLGFAPAGDANGTSLWRLELAAFSPIDVPMRLEASPAAQSAAAPGENAA